MSMLAQRSVRTAWWRYLLAAFAGLLVAFGGCDADPMPSPGSLDQMKIILTSSTSVRPGGPIDLIGIVGLPKAAPGVGFVVIRSQFARSEAPATADGTFAGLLPGAAGDTVTMTFKATESGPESKPIVLTVRGSNTATGTAAGGGASSVPSAPATNGQGANTPTGGFSDAGTAMDAGTASDAGTPAPGVDGGAGGTQSDMDGGTSSNVGGGPVMTAGIPDAQGESEVTGSGLVPGDGVILGNTRSGEVVQTMVASDGTVSTQIGAQPGDRIEVIIQDPGTGETSELATLSVP